MLSDTKMGVRRFGRVNWMGLFTLSRREILRFWVVWTQTLLAPLVTAALFLMIFNIAIGPKRGDVMGVPFIAFLAPGIMMMAVIQNAFANTSSSIVISKVQGNIVDTLMPPLSGLEMVLGYLAGGVARGIVVAFGIWIGLFVFLGIGMAHPFYFIAFIILGAAFLGGLGIIAGVYANKFDQMAAITNFIITPLAFLSGSFYSITSLPDVIRHITLFNPIFYLIDGVRFSVLGVSDGPASTGVLISLFAVFVVNGIAWAMLKTGYRLKA